MELMEVTKKYNQIVILQQLQQIQLIVPNNFLLPTVFTFASITYLTFLLIVDNIATTPFAVKHMSMISMFTIPTLIAFMRLNIQYVVYNSMFLYILFFFLIAGIFGTLLSNKIKLSWYGSIERGMGFSFYIQQFILLDVFVYLLTFYGAIPVVILLAIQGILETFVIILQYIQSKHPKDPNYKFFNHLLQMNNRYVGTLSNPIHTAWYLVMLLPVMLYLIILNPNFIGLTSFISVYAFISLGVFFSQGRMSVISYLTVTIGSILITLMTNAPYKIPIIVFLLVMIGIQYYVYKDVNHQSARFSELKLDINDPNIEIDEKYARIYANNSRPILWKTAFNYILKNKKYILKGDGLSNIPSAYFKTASKELNRYFNDHLIDSSHNYILDTIISHGWIGQILTIGSFISMFIISIIHGMYIPQLALLAFGLESMTAFPLQGNLLTIFLILMIPIGTTFQYTHMITLPIILPILFGLQIFVSIINYQRFTNINLSMGHLSVQYALANQKSKHQLNELQTSFQIQPYYDRGYCSIGNVIGGPLRSNITFDDLVILSIMLEDYKKTNIIENEPSFYYNLQNIYIQISSMLIQSYITARNQTKDDPQKIKPSPYLNTSVSKQKQYQFKSLRLNPYSVSTLLGIHYYYGFIEQNPNIATKIINKIIDIITDEYEDNKTHREIAKKYLLNFNEKSDPKFNEYKSKILKRWPKLNMNS